MELFGCSSRSAAVRANAWLLCSSSFACFHDPSLKLVQGKIEMRTDVRRRIEAVHDFKDGAQMRRRLGQHFLSTCSWFFHSAPQ
jgi:hypothetical protein